MCTSLPKLCKNQFSNSARITTFLSTVSQYQVEVMHIPGKDNLVSDYGSRNPIQCNGPCQICSFVEKTEQCVVRDLKVSDLTSETSSIQHTSRGPWLPYSVEKAELCVVRDLKVSDIMSGASRVPYASRGPWLQSQRECPDLVKVHEYLSNGTRPAQSKKRYYRH